MALILDTHVLIWFGAADSRLSTAAREAIEAPNAALLVSAVTAWEYADLKHRGRLPAAANFDLLQNMLGFALNDFPAEAWPLAGTLPDIHRDPVDRMLVAHTLVGGHSLVTADETLRQYPVPTIW